MGRIEELEKNAIATAYSFRVHAKGISFNSKGLRQHLSKFDDNKINDYMIDLLSKNNNEIINEFNSLGISAKNSKKVSRINAIIEEMKKRFPNSEIRFNQEDNTFSVIGNENITLKLVKENDKYSVQRVNNDTNTQRFDNDANTNASNSNSKGKQYTLSNGKQSSRLFADEDAA